MGAGLGWCEYFGGVICPLVGCFVDADAGGGTLKCNVLSARKLDSRAPSSTNGSVSALTALASLDEPEAGKTGSGVFKSSPSVVLSPLFAPIAPNSNAWPALFFGVSRSMRSSPSRPAGVPARIPKMLSRPAPNGSGTLTGPGIQSLSGSDSSARLSLCRKFSSSSTTTSCICICFRFFGVSLSLTFSFPFSPGCAASSPLPCASLTSSFSSAGTPA